jgi:hypothetical protein
MDFVCSCEMEAHQWVAGADHKFLYLRLHANELIFRSKSCCERFFCSKAGIGLQIARRVLVSNMMHLCILRVDYLQSWFRSYLHSHRLRMRRRLRVQPQLFLQLVLKRARTDTWFVTILKPGRLSMVRGQKAGATRT